MSLKHLNLCFVLVLFINAQADTNDSVETHSTADDFDSQLKFATKKIIHAVYNHNFSQPYTISTSINEYINPEKPLAIENEMIKQEPISIAKDNQMQLTEQQYQPIVCQKLNSNNDNQWACQISVSLSMVKDAIEIKYPIINTVVFDLDANKSIYLSSISFKLSAKPEIIDYLKIRKKNCS